MFLAAFEINLDYADSLGGSQVKVNMKRSIQDFWRNTRGQDLVEYALAAGMVAVAAVACLPPLGAVVGQVFNAIGGIVQNNIQ